MNLTFHRESHPENLHRGSELESGIAGADRGRKAYSRISAEEMHNTKRKKEKEKKREEKRKRNENYKECVCRRGWKVRQVGKGEPWGVARREDL